MAETEPATSTNEEKSKDKMPSGVLGKALYFLQSGWPPQVLLYAGITLLILVHVKIPNYWTPNQSDSGYEFRLGLVLTLVGGVSGVLVWAIGPNAVRQSIGRFRLSAIALMLVGGLAACTIILLSHPFGLIGLPKSDTMRGALDEAAIFLALTSWFGLVPAAVSASRLEKVPRSVKDAMDTLASEQKALLDSMKTESAGIVAQVPLKIEAEISRLREREVEFLDRLRLREEQLVNRVVDATRKPLRGFDEVFTCALGMLRRAKDELIVVNFAMNFGAPHRFNEELRRGYAANHNGADITKDSRTFTAQLHSRIYEIEHVQILTISKEGVGKNFLRPLAARHEYKALQPYQILEAEEANWSSARDEVRDAMTKRRQQCGACVQMYEADSLPIQLLITRVSEDSELPRYGCLVFMVGSDMLESRPVAGSEPAFYTELPDMVEVFRTLAAALNQAARPILP